jgi:hypothetical protein
MPVRKATPEETQAFWGKPVIVFGQKRPDSSKEKLKSSDQQQPQEDLEGSRQKPPKKTKI